MKNIKVKVAAWVKSHYVNLAVFNALVMILVLLHSARYFDPFWLISINIVIILTLVASVLLLGARSNTFFILTLIFWIFAAFFKLIKIGVWAERTTVYAFEALMIGVILLFFEKD